MNVQLLYECVSCSGRTVVELDIPEGPKFFCSPFKCSCGKMMLILLNSEHPHIHISALIDGDLMESSTIKEERKVAHCVAAMDDLINQGGFEVDSANDRVYASGFEGFFEVSWLRPGGSDNLLPCGDFIPEEPEEIGTSSGTENPDSQWDGLERSVGADPTENSDWLKDLDKGGRLPF